MTQPPEIQRLERRLSRERAARIEAETIAERVTADQFNALNELIASRLVLDETPDYVAITDPQGQTSYLNRALRELSGIEIGAVGAVHISSLLSEDSREQLETEALPALHAKGVWRGEFTLHRAHGPDVPVSQVLIGHVDQAGALRHISFIARDVTEERELADLLQHRSTHDALTGLPNRRLLFERLDQSMGEQVVANGRPLAVLFMDLDGFKHVNDTHGHDVGDKLLVAVSERLQSRTRSRDVLARVGGDEFVSLCELVGGSPEADEIALRMIAAIAPPFDIGGRKLRIGLSVGVACTVDPDISPDLLVRHADQAMYEAKRSGKGTYRVVLVGAETAPEQ